MSDIFKLNTYVDKKELADYLRALADAVENGGKDEFACVDDFKKIKIAIKNEFGQVQLKAKIKSAKPCGPFVVNEDGEVVETKPNYSSLKKRMRSSFKMLVKMIHDGNVPPKEAVDAFLTDSALMVTYPGYGDEYYEVYTKVCDDFRKAFDSGDIDKMHTAVDALVHEKSRCHAKYD